MRQAVCLQQITPMCTLNLLFPFSSGIWWLMNWCKTEPRASSQIKPRSKAPNVPWLLAARCPASWNTFPFLLLPLFPQGFNSVFPSEEKVVSQAKRTKDFGSLHGRIQCDLWACRAGLSGAPKEQTARKPPSCSRLSQAWDLGSCFCVERHLLWQAEKPRGFLCNKPSRHPHSVSL